MSFEGLGNHSQLESTMTLEDEKGGSLSVPSVTAIRMLKLFDIMPANRLISNTKIMQNVVRATGQSEIFWKRLSVTVPKDESNVSAVKQNKVI